MPVWRALPKMDLQHLKITDPELATMAFASDCNHANDAIKNTIASLLLIESERVEQFTTESVGMDLHIGLINKFFDGLPIGTDAHTQLYTVLTNVAKIIGRDKFSTEKTSDTIDDFLRVMSIMKTNIGNKGNPVMVYSPF